MNYQEHVFRPSRRVNSKSVKGRLYVGQYFFKGMARPKRIRLNTPDKAVAEQLLRAIVVEKQKEAVGLFAPKAQRQAMVADLRQHVADYKRNLVAMGRATIHIRGTIQRIDRMIRAAGWKSLADVTVETFSRAWETLKGSAKTKKEYQVSMRAFLNWLVEQGRLERSPLQKLKLIDVRGKYARKPRAYTTNELERLYAVNKRRGVVYRFLTYTGAREGEGRAIAWGSVYLEAGGEFVVFEETTTKDKERREVALHPRLAAELRKIRPANVKPSDLVFAGWFPAYDTLRQDLERAGIAHKDALGRVVNFQAFRTTFNSFGDAHGLSLVARQKMLGHSKPDMTANVYTDVAALSLHNEIAKLPWIETEEERAHGDAHETVFSGHKQSQEGTGAENPSSSKVSNFPLKSPAPAQTGTDGPVSSWALHQRLGTRGN